MRGEPGTLGLYWSDFQTAARPYELLELGITHRLMLGLRVLFAQKRTMIWLEI